MRLYFLPTAYVVRREGYVLTRVCPSVYPHLGGRGGTLARSRWGGRGYPSQVWWGRGTPLPVGPGWGGGLPHTSGSTSYTMVSMPLAFTQDFLVFIVFNETNITSIIVDTFVDNVTNIKEWRISLWRLVCRIRVLSQTKLKGKTH